MQHYWWCTWILCVCRRQSTVLRGSGDPYTRQQVLQVLVSTRTFVSLLLATGESYLQSQRAQTVSFFNTLICPFNRCDSQRQAHSSLAHFPFSYEDLQQLIPRVSTCKCTATGKLSIIQLVWVIRPIPACWGHPGLQGSLQHCTITQCAEETLWKLW